MLSFLHLLPCTYTPSAIPGFISFHENVIFHFKQTDLSDSGGYCSELNARAGKHAVQPWGCGSVLPRDNGCHTDQCYWRGCFAKSPCLLLVTPCFPGSRGDRRKAQRIQTISSCCHDLNGRLNAWILAVFEAFCLQNACLLCMLPWESLAACVK